MKREQQAATSNGDGDGEKDTNERGTQCMCVCVASDRWKSGRRVATTISTAQLKTLRLPNWNRFVLFFSLFFHKFIIIY